MIDSKYNFLKDEILNFNEVCKLLKVSQPTLWRRLSNKRVPSKIYGKKFDRAWKIQRKDVYRYLNEEDH
ncbi:hypothetical protein ES705_01658 [subsurface metagenome]|nr:helix-turn-helix domain-containing protein [Clostridia bacterium]